jgi:hypothetical protein
VRINYDQALTPTVIFHAGGGYQRYHNPDSAPQNILDFDPVAELGLTGGFGIGFPRFTALSSSQGARLDMSRREFIRPMEVGGSCDRGGNRIKKPW